MTSTRSKLVIKPADVFSGATVRRKFREQVASILDRHCVRRDEVLEGTMLTNKWATHWHVFGGNAHRSPAFWGSPSTFVVTGEATRAKVLQELGVDMSKSRTYAKYDVPSTNQEDR